MLDLTNAEENFAKEPDYRYRPESNAEVRREERREVSDPLTLRLLKASKLVEGQLLDVNTHGFKLRHDCLELTPGQKVQVLYSWGKVWARVIWTKEQGPHYHSVFELGQEE